MIYREQNQSTEVRERMRGGSGAAQLTALTRELPKNLRLYSLIRLTPGSSIGYHVHENETELFHFLSGSGIVDDNGVKAAVSAGDTLSTPDGFGHAVENSGAEDLVFLAVNVRD
jgi:mannose-6-phosphate isomerase-like protein (cupin superfamily)